MSSGPSRARVMEMERLVNSIFPRRSRAVDDAATVLAADVRPVELSADDVLDSSQPCFCPVFSPCVGKCHRTFRYW
ncbi:unnamed protein product [Heligmosomoides polygyrus]|uniref:Uncharacterized protein n=1 Tax=Heligmosomoides polygyrus TaxID=6339 RepID=A0A183GPL0_HELPZ|nr:unnamed protein product [Heligmosomoides polygyrus]